MNSSGAFAVVILLVYLAHSTNGALRRCFVCRSRGELGSCKDSFTLNATDVEHEKGVETSPCASGWCGKVVESENEAKEEYGVATQRMCLQRGPPDNEDRCAYTVLKAKRVLMCFCRGDLCNGSVHVKPLAVFILVISSLPMFRLIFNT